MNESFVLRFKRGTELWPLRTLSADGLIFDEFDAPPRRLVMEFDGRSPVVELRLNRIRALRGWHPWEFHLVSFVRDGGLGFRGVDQDALPPGDYKIKLRIDGLVVGRSEFRFRIPTDGAQPVDVPVQADMRSVRPVLVNLDAQIARLLDAPLPLPIDGAATCHAWLDRPEPRATRKACLLNLLAQLRVTPSRTAPLITDVVRVLRIRDDRIYAEVNQNLYESVRTMASDPLNQKFWAEGEPHAAVHLQLLDAFPQPYGRSTHRLESYRAEGSASQPALQAVFAIPRDPSVKAYYAEFDIDLGNPLQDVEGFVIHMGELADNKPTNHLDLRERLTRAKDFLYYAVSNA